MQSDYSATKSFFKKLGVPYTELYYSFRVVTLHTEVDEELIQGYKGYMADYHFEKKTGKLISIDYFSERKGKRKGQITKGVIE